MTPDFDLYFDDAPISAEPADNPEPRLPVVFALDCSGSMSGKPLQTLNEKFSEFIRECQQGPLLSKRLEVAVVAFPPVATTVDWQSVAHYRPKPFPVGNGGTPLAGALIHALDLVEERKRYYKLSSLHYFRPMIYLLTDGEPTDPEKIAEATAKARDSQARKKAAIWAFHVDTEGVGPSVMQTRLRTLRDLTGREALGTRADKLDKLMNFMSASIEAVGNSADFERPDNVPNYEDFLGASEY